MISQQVSKPRISLRGVRWLARLCFLALALIVVLGVVAPFISANAFRPNIQGALEDALGRKVEIESVHFSLFGGPGFVLDNVTINEDPKYGLEPFAYVPTLALRVRVDKLLLGQIRPLGLRLEDASVNLVKSDDGTWNVVSLVERLGAPRRTPLNLLPVVELADGRLDFKLGVRKTTLYITETEVSIYPETSGKIFVRFEGSPARTDRAGNGFGHLVGTANWYLKPAALSGNQLEADVNLQPSSISEITTLFQGQDLGVHGTISSHVVISGPFSALHASGDMQLQDVHRWDLLPSPGDSLEVGFRGAIDLNAHTLALETVPTDGGPSPVSLQLRVADFMTNPNWSVLANLHKAPLAGLLPLARRMGLNFPTGLQMEGALDGALGISRRGGLEGGVAISDAVARVPGIPALRSAQAKVTISGNLVHVDPAILESELGGTLRAGGTFNFDTQETLAEMDADQVSIPQFKETVNAWFGLPDALAALTGGRLSGHFAIHTVGGQAETEAAARPTWSGQVQLVDATLDVPGISRPVARLQGKAAFDGQIFDMPRFSASVEKMPLNGSYRYSAASKHPERLRLEIGKADLDVLDSLLSPTLTDDSLLAHLPFSRRKVPAWLESRNMDGDVTIDQVSLQKTLLGPAAAHFQWQGSTVQLSGVRVGLPVGRVGGSGSVSLAGRVPNYRMALELGGYAWGGGRLMASGILDTSGVGVMTLQHLEASGEFEGTDISFPNAEPLSSISGKFSFAFKDDLPMLKLTNLAAVQNDVDWSGDGASNNEGKLAIDLTDGAHKQHLVGDLLPTSGQNHVIASSTSKTLEGFGVR